MSYLRSSLLANFHRNVFTYDNIFFLITNVQYGMIDIADNDLLSGQYDMIIFVFDNR